MKPYYFVFALLLLSFKTIAYPISPVPLRKLVEISDYIIVGNVIGISEKHDKHYHAIATAAVIESIQGNLRRDTIQISFNPNMICPSPDRYFKGTSVLAFLRKNGTYYKSVALDYGAKTLNFEDIKVYKDRIFELQNMFDVSEEKHRSNTIEWLVKCAKHPATRWEGVYELSPESNFMSYYARSIDYTLRDLLTNNQKSRLKQALLNSEESDYTDFGLVDLVYYSNEKEIDDFLIKRLKSLNKNYYWYIGDFVERLKHLNNGVEMYSVIEKINSLELEYEQYDEKKQLINEFVMLIEKS